MRCLWIIVFLGFLWSVEGVLKGFLYRVLVGLLRFDGLNRVF